jgi:hypothetical protein
MGSVYESLRGLSAIQKSQERITKTKRRIIMDEMSLVRKIKEQEETIINLRADVTLLTEIIRDLEGKNRGLENSRNFIMNVLKQ